MGKFIPKTKWPCRFFLSHWYIYTYVLLLDMAVYIHECNLGGRKSPHHLQVFAFPDLVLCIHVHLLVSNSKWMQVAGEFLMKSILPSCGHFVWRVNPKIVEFGCNVFITKSLKKTRKSEAELQGLVYFGQTNSCSIFLDHKSLRSIANTLQKTRVLNLTPMVCQ